jgi:hypothetical protein
LRRLADRPHPAPFETTAKLRPDNEKYPRRKKPLSLNTAHLMSIAESIIAKRALDNLKSRFYVLLCILRPDTKPIKNILANIPARRLRTSLSYQ